MRSEEVFWNDSVFAGLIRVAIYSASAFTFWRNYFYPETSGTEHWIDLVVAVICTLFIITSAGWAFFKWSERRKQRAL